MRILIVEDELKTAEYLHQGLTESGYVVDIATNGVDGLHMAAQASYELIILDVDLPEIDGWGVLASIRRNSRTPVMMLTARGRLADKLKGFDSGADDYLVKPFEFPSFWPEFARCYEEVNRSARQTCSRSTTLSWIQPATAPIATANESI